MLTEKPELILNSDQSGFLLETHWQRTLEISGMKTVHFLPRVFPQQLIRTLYVPCFLWMECFLRQFSWCCRNQPISVNLLNSPWKEMV